MEQATPPQNNNNNAGLKSYFLFQGQKILKLNELLDRGTIRAYMGRLIYVVVEFGLYIFFVLALIIAISIPSEITQHIQVDKSNAIDVTLTNQDVKDMVLVIQFFIVILAFFPLILARIIRNARKKTKIIQEAYEITSDMKEEYEKSLKSGLI